MCIRDSLFAAQMGIYFCGAEVLMAKDILKHTDIHAAMLVHQRRRRMPELMRRVAPVSYTHLDVYKRQALPPRVILDGDGC